MFWTLRIQLQVATAFVVSKHHIKGRRLRLPLHFSFVVESRERVRVVRKVNDEIVDGTVPPQVKIVVMAAPLVLYVIVGYGLPQCGPCLGEDIRRLLGKIMTAMAGSIKTARRFALR